MALTKEDLQAIGELMDNKLSVALEPVHKRLDSVDKRLDLLQESVDEVRETTNTIVEWTEVTSDVLGIPFPVKK